jgi:AraC family transcriptional regulator
MQKTRHIALVLRGGAPHIERIVEGVLAYAKSNERRWSYITMPESQEFNVSEPVGIDAILQASSVSRRWLEGAFSRRFGVAPYRYLLDLRIARARQLLRNDPTLSVREVAHRCGFSSGKQLSAVFRRELGVSASGYREGEIK